MVTQVSKQALKLVDEGCVKVPEAMRLLGIKSRTTITVMMESGELPYIQYKPNGERRIPLSVIKRKMAQHLIFNGESSNV